MTTNDYVHVPVLVNDVLQGLVVQSDGVYVDCTFGRGGHSQAILDLLGDKGKLFVFDKDPEAIDAARNLVSKDARVQFFHSSFSNIYDILTNFGLQESIDGILFDIGISSPQVENSERGFSFNLQGKLDMRMDNTSGPTAATLVNNVSVDDLAFILKEYGEEKFSRRIAKAIVASRDIKPILTTLELSEVVCSAVPFREKKKHPATRTFQAIRIYLNNELDDLASGLVQAFKLLRMNGRLAVICFHSLEDRIVKRFMRKYSTNDPYPKEIPVTAEMIKPRMKIIGKVIKPKISEISSNPRARSAKLRIAEKISV